MYSYKTLTNENMKNIRRWHRWSR